MAKKKSLTQLFTQYPELLFEGQKHEIVGRFRCVQANDAKRLDIMFLNRMRVLEEWTMLPNDKGELVPDINTPYQTIVDNDPIILEWFKQAKHEDVVENEYDVELYWNICEFEEGKITYFVRERWKAFDLARYYVTLEYPNNPPVWL